MDAVVILLALSAVTGFTVGTSFRRFSILISSIALAILSAAVLHIAGFGALSGILIIVVSLAVNQMAYLIGVAGSGLGQPRKSPGRHDQVADVD